MQDSCQQMALLLIVPYGIEIASNSLLRIFSTLLIVPYGIEITEILNGI